MLKEERKVDSNDMSLFIFIMIVSGGILIGGFFLGKRYENAQWRKLLPDAMDSMCQECYDINRGIK